MNEADQREDAIFEAAVQLPPQERAGYLDRTCAGDLDLRRRVESLLSALERAGGFMKQPAITVIPRTVILPPSEKPGAYLGGATRFNARPGMVSDFPRGFGWHPARPARQPGNRSHVRV